MGMSDEQIGEVFKSLGRIEQKIDSHIDTVANHVEHDEKVQKYLFDKLDVLEASHNKQKGAIKIICTVGSAVGAGIGYVAEKIFFGHHG